VNVWTLDALTLALVVKRIAHGAQRTAAARRTRVGAFGTSVTADARVLIRTEHRLDLAVRRERQIGQVIPCNRGVCIVIVYGSGKSSLQSLCV
jgi:hypothetical protein